MSGGDGPAVLVERSGGVLTVTINRPAARNAVNAAVAEGLSAAMETLDTDDSLVVGVLTGSGTSFCAGMDLKAFAQGDIPRIAGKGFAGLTEAPPRKPLIAAVEGLRSILREAAESIVGIDLELFADVTNDRGQRSFLWGTAPVPTPFCSWPWS